MWDKLKELIQQYSEISRDARTGGITSSIRDIDNLNISDSEKRQRKQELGKSVLLGGLGDIGEAYQIRQDVKNKDYKSAAWGAGLLLLPGAMGKVLPKLPLKGIADTFDEVPASAFKSRPTPIDDVRSVVKPSKSAVKFQDDVVKGAYFARRHSAPTASMKEFDFDDLFAERMNDFRSGLESSVLVEGDQALKFSKGNWLEADITSEGWKGLRSRNSRFENLKDMATAANAHLKDVNRLWYSEPQSLAGYWKNWRGEHIPVFSQRAMGTPLTDVDLQRTDGLSLNHIDFDPESAIKSRVPFTFNTRVVSAPGNLTPAQTRQVEYVLGKGKNSILKNNIFSENDLLPPLDAHTGNFMFDKEGILRAIDIHKKGGNVNAE